jgi:hypothetical protein
LFYFNITSHDVKLGVTWPTTFVLPPPFGFAAIGCFLFGGTPKLSNRIVDSIGANLFLVPKKSAPIGSRSVFGGRNDPIRTVKIGRSAAGPLAEMALKIQKLSTLGRYKKQLKLSNGKAGLDLILSFRLVCDKKHQSRVEEFRHRCRVSRPV